MNWFVVICAAAVLVLCGTVAAIARAPTPSNTEFEQRLAPVRELVLDPKGQFSFSQVYPKLEAIEQLARRIGTDSPERARTLDLMTLVRFKHQDFEDVLRLGTECLNLKSAGAIPPPDRILLMHRVAKSAEQLRRYAIAVDRYRAVLDLDASAKNTLLDDAQRLGMLEHIGYVLHEQGRYADALATNRRMLVDAERVFGANDARLTTVLINLAQNLYKLGKIDEAQTTLQRCLTLAQQAHKDEVADNALFQLGVLSFERGDFAGARRRMQERIRIAEQSHDADSLARATQDAAELEQRIAKH